MAIICMFGVYGKGLYFMTFINFVAFLLVYRGLYVDGNTPSMIVAGIIIILTIKFT